MNRRRFLSGLAALPMVGWASNLGLALPPPNQSHVKPSRSPLDEKDKSDYEYFCDLIGTPEGRAILRHRLARGIYRQMTERSLAHRVLVSDFRTESNIYTPPLPINAVVVGEDGGDVVTLKGARRVTVPKFNVVCSPHIPSARLTETDKRKLYAFLHEDTVNEFIGINDEYLVALLEAIHSSPIVSQDWSMEGVLRAMRALSTRGFTPQHVIFNAEDVVHSHTYGTKRTNTGWTYHPDFIPERDPRQIGLGVLGVFAEEGALEVVFLRSDRIRRGDIFVIGAPVKEGRCNGRVIDHAVIGEVCEHKGGLDVATTDKPLVFCHMSDGFSFSFSYNTGLMVDADAVQRVRVSGRPMRRLGSTGHGWLRTEWS